MFSKLCRHQEVLVSVGTPLKPILVFWIIIIWEWVMRALELTVAHMDTLFLCNLRWRLRVVWFRTALIVILSFTTIIDVMTRLFTVGTNEGLRKLHIILTGRWCWRLYYERFLKLLFTFLHVTVWRGVAIFMADRASFDGLRAVGRNPS